MSSQLVLRTNYNSVTSLILTGTTMLITFFFFFFLVGGVPTVVLHTSTCYVEECADTNLCGLNPDPQPTNTAVEMDCAIGVT